MFYVDPNKDVFDMFCPTVGTDKLFKECQILRPDEMLLIF
jgi:hypothetical protein